MLPKLNSNLIKLKIPFLFYAVWISYLTKLIVKFINTYDEFEIKTLYFVLKVKLIVNESLSRIDAKMVN